MLNIHCLASEGFNNLEKTERYINVGFVDSLSISNTNLKLHTSVRNFLTCRDCTSLVGSLKNARMSFLSLVHSLV